MARRSLLLVPMVGVALLLATCEGQQGAQGTSEIGAACPATPAGMEIAEARPVGRNPVGRNPVGRNPVERNPVERTGRGAPEISIAAAATAAAKAATGKGPDAVTTFAGSLPPLPAEGPLLGTLDLDGDGKPDHFSARWQGGSGFGGLQLRLTSSRLRDRFTLDSFGSFGQFLGVLRLPSPLATDPRLLRGLIALLYGEPHLRALHHERALPGTLPPAADGSFEWLVERLLFPPLVPRAPFTERRWYHPRWTPGRPTLPPSQVAPLLRRQSWRLVRALHVGDGAELAQVPERPDGAPRALIAYHAHNHGALRPAGQCGSWTLYATAHGLVVYDATRNAHSWAWVSTGVQKLRWPSLLRAACHDGLLVLERDDRRSVELVVVDPVAGRLGRLPLRRGAAWRLEGPKGRLEADSTHHGLAALREALSSPKEWATASDLDGDGRPDPIAVTFTKGAHCCYRLSLRSTRAGKDFPLPFELDGGYVGGLDLSQPARFHLADYDGDGLPDLFLEIATYNGEPQPLPAAWRRRYGLRTHHVVVGLRGGRLAVRDLE